MAPLLDRVRERLASARVFDSPRARRRFAVHATAAAAALVAVALLVERHVPFLTDPEALRTFVRGFGVWGPLVLIALQTVQVVVAPVPGQVLAVVAGYLYGLWWGTLYNVIGIGLGSAIAFWLSRRYGRRYVESMAHDETLSRFDAVVEGRARAGLFVLFLLPGLPDDLLCFVGGLTDVPLWQLIAIAVVARAPAFLLVNAVGDLIGTGRYGVAAVVAAVVVAAAVVGYLNRERIVRLLDGDAGSE